MFVPYAAGLLGLLAAPPAAETPAAPSDAAVREPLPWILRHPPRRNTLHLGVFGGVLLPAPDLELFEIDAALPDQGFKPFAQVAPELGARVGYLPLSFLGVEAEGAYAFGRLNDDTSVGLWTVRGHVLAQLPRWSITPFVLAGAGVVGVTSGRAAVGSDSDLAFHFGGGASVSVTRWLTLRLDIRDVITPRQGAGATNNPEILLGIGWTRRPPARTVTTRDAMPIAIEASAPPPDADGDGFVDDEDACPREAGLPPDGRPDPDHDGDGVLGDADLCPDEKGPAPTGCPSRDADADGVLDEADACPQEAETFNGFDDDDGCPDAMPEDLGAFEGTLEGVNFSVDSANLQPSSQTKLGDVVAVLKKYPTTRVEISGHTDSTGSSEHNVELSQARADAVKAYLVGEGIDPERVRTRGAGPDEPIDTNASADGRAKNRRIEFRLLN